MAESTGLQSPSRVAGFVALGLSLFVGISSLLTWCHFTHPLKKNYMVDAIRLETNMVFPMWKLRYWVRPDGRMATLADPPPYRDGPKKTIDSARFSKWLVASIYEGHSIWWALKWVESAFLLSLFGGIFAVAKWNNRGREGKRLRGPRLLTHSEWNKRVKNKQNGFFIETL